MNKHEISAWWRLGLGGAFLAYLCWQLFSPAQAVGEAGWDGLRGTLNVFVALFFVAYGFVNRRNGIEEDERDRVISGVAARTALFALILVVVLSPMVMSGSVVPRGLVTREADWLIFYAVACGIFAMAIEAAVTVFHHWRDRR